MLGNKAKKTYSNMLRQPVTSKQFYTTNQRKCSSLGRLKSINIINIYNTESNISIHLKAYNDPLVNVHLLLSLICLLQLWWEIPGFVC